MTTARIQSCHNCGAPSTGPYCAAHELVSTASRRTPEPGVLAPTATYYRLSATEAQTLAYDLLACYERLRGDARRTSLDCVEAAVDAAMNALTPYAELPPPLRRTPSRDGESVLGRVIDQAVLKYRGPYLSPGMTALCVDCCGQYRDEDALADHQRAAHPEEAR